MAGKRHGKGMMMLHELAEGPREVHASVLRERPAFSLRNEERPWGPDLPG